MSKDAKGHGSNARGAYMAARNAELTASGPRPIFAGKPELGTVAADKAAADTLGGGHPKSAPVPVHDAMSKQYFPKMSDSDKQASRDRNSASERDDYNRDLSLRSRNGQVGSGMKYRG